MRVLSSEIVSYPQPRSDVAAVFDKGRISQMVDIAADDFVKNQKYPSLKSRITSFNSFRAMGHPPEYIVMNPDFFALSIRTQGWMPLHLDDFNSRHVYYIKHPEHGSMLLVVRCEQPPFGGHDDTPTIAGGRAIFCCDSSAFEYIRELMAGIAEKAMTLREVLELSFNPTYIQRNVRANFIETYCVSNSDVGSHRAWNYLTDDYFEEHRERPRFHYKDGVYYVMKNVDLFALSDELNLHELKARVGDMYQEVREWRQKQGKE